MTDWKVRFTKNSYPEVGLIEDQDHLAFRWNRYGVAGRTYLRIVSLAGDSLSKTKEDRQLRKTLSTIIKRAITNEHRTPNFYHTLKAQLEAECYREANDIEDIDGYSLCVHGRTVTVTPTDWNNSVAVDPDWDNAPKKICYSAEEALQYIHDPWNSNS